ncbi:MAG: PEP/pyruvate-binding domain-containing protein, partial [Myxococcota bacterium]
STARASAPRRPKPATGSDARRPVLDPPRAHTSATAAADTLWTTRTRIALKDGATDITSRATFEKLARRDDSPGAPGAREVKFLILGVDTDKPQLYFVNTNTHDYHYKFASEGLGKQISLEEFNRLTYFSDSRKNLAGTLVAHDSYAGAGGKKGLYAMEFWPTDPVRAKHVATAFKLIDQHMPFAKGQVRYHPAGNTQEALFKQDAAALERQGVKSISTAELFKNVTYTPMNPGEGFGVLRVMDDSSIGRPPSVRDVVIFKTLPNDLSHVGGVITEAPQTPLSHVNLKAKQNDTPNAFVKDATTDPRIAPFIGKLVHYKVGPDGFELKEATQAEANAWLEKMRPPKVQKPPRDLSQKNVVDLDQLSNKDTKAFGAKAANLGELRNILPAAQVPDGYGIPFSFYDDFMKANGLYDAAKKMMADPKFQADPAERDRQLSAFRRKVRDAPVPPQLEAKLAALQAKFPADQALRCRSSTNNEDLPGFNGAGLYDSYTHRPDEGKLSSTVKQVWASLWNYRAFEEREFNRIDHLAAAMAVAVHPNQDDEQANGVAVTKNIYDPNWPGFYVNAQVGESLVTNPDPNATPDELLISAIGEHGEWETQFIRHSTETKNGKPVLTEAQTIELREAMEKIQAHFKRLYRGDERFAMDIEFKITTDGHLSIKQARPWVE